jgi:hypothetical protein
MRELGHPNWSDTIQKNRTEEAALENLTHGDPMVPEDHDEIKSEELAALQHEVDGLKVALGTRTIIGKAMGASWNARASMRLTRSRS